MDLIIDYTSPYVTRDEFLKVKGIDLTIELQDNDNKSNKVERFIADITNWVRKELVLKYLDNDLNSNVTEFSSLAEWRRKRFHAGMIEEIQYLLDNGLLQQDSGIIKETGMIMDYSQILISNPALNEFRMGAFCNIQTA